MPEGYFSRAKMEILIISYKIFDTVGIRINRFTANTKGIL